MDSMCVSFPLADLHPVHLDSSELELSVQLALAVEHESLKTGMLTFILQLGE